MNSLNIGPVYSKELNKTINLVGKYFSLFLLFILNHKIFKVFNQIIFFDLKFINFFCLPIFDAKEWKTIKIISNLFFVFYPSFAAFQKLPIFIEPFNIQIIF